MRGYVILGDKNVELSASAATPYLYKQLFKSDLLIDIKKLRDSSDDKIEVAGTTIDLFQQLTYIMYLEANFKVEELYHRMNVQEYIRFLMDIDNNAIIQKAREILAIYNGNSKTLSEAKNE